jgi:hypothetical protein
MNCKPAIGTSFGRLLLSNILDSTFVLCRCACGTEQFRCRLANLRNGTTKSCGCLRREAGQRNATHGMTKTPEYRAWQSMRARCTDPTDKSFIHYGGRGIAVCQAWEESFETFLADMGRRPTAKHSIDREKNDGNYEPGNCRWATRLQQTRNRRIAILIEYEGEKVALQDLCDRHGLSYSTVHSRIYKHGWPVALALTTKLQRRRVSDTTEDTAERLPAPREAVAA